MTEETPNSKPPDSGDDVAAEEEYSLAKTDPAPRVLKLPIEVELAVAKAEAKVEVDIQKEASVRPLQFTIRDMLIWTTVVAFLMGVVATIGRGLPAILIYSGVLILMIAAWLTIALRELGYWPFGSPSEDSPREDPSEKIDEDSEAPPEGESVRHLFQYPIVDLFLVVAVFAFLMSFCELLPSDRKLSNVAGVSGFFSLVGLGWFALSENRHPRMLLLWGLMIVTYLLATLAALVQSKERAEALPTNHRIAAAVKFEPNGNAIGSHAGAWERSISILI